MSVLWSLLVVFAVVHNDKTASGLLVEKDASRPKECSSENCGPNLRPIPIVLSERDRYQIDSVTEETVPGGKYFHNEPIKTNFTCDDKPYIPGFYADMDTGCEVFHLCMKTTVDHFLCPIGTGFDQKYLVCSPDGKKYCQVTIAGYIMNLRVPATFPIISGPKGYDLNWDRANVHYKQLKEYQSTNPDMVDWELIRILMLLQFVEVSHFLPEMVAVESPYLSQKSAGIDTSQMFFNVLDDMLFNVFPLIPENYSVDPQLPLHYLNSEKTSTVSKQKDVEESPHSSWDYHKADTEKVPKEGKAPGRSAFDNETRKRSGRVLSSSKDPSQRALNIIGTILDVIASMSSKISPVSRNNIVGNYVNYLNKLSRTQKNSTAM